MGSKSSSDATSNNSDTSSVDPAVEEAGPEYDIARLIHLARLLTANPAFLYTDSASAEQLLDMTQAPGCDASSGPFVDLYNSMTSDPPTYTGEDPIADILLTLRQLASCQKSVNKSIFSKFSNWITMKDGGKAIRGMLLLSKVIIECLALWYAMKQDGTLDDSSLQQMQLFTKAAIEKHGVTNVDESLLPSVLQNKVQDAENWDRNPQTVVSTFAVDPESPAPAMLVFNEPALEAVMQETESGRPLPTQLRAGENNAVPIVMMNREKVKNFVEGYVGSGPVQEAPNLPQSE